MATPEKVGIVTRLHLSFKRIVERSHDMVYVIPRQISANPDGYVADILEANHEFEQLANSLPDEINTWTDGEFEEALRELHEVDKDASERLKNLVSQAEELQAVGRGEIQKTCTSMCSAALHSQEDKKSSCESMCICGQRFRPHAAFCGHCGSPRQEFRSLNGAPFSVHRDSHEERSEHDKGRTTNFGFDNPVDTNRSERDASSCPQPLLRELVADNKRRFTEELEFVLLLADVRYVNWLALQGYFQDEACLSFLRYLLYWREKPYVEWVIYPQALRMLQMLQDPLFREKVKRVDVCEWLYRQNLHSASVPEVVKPRKGDRLYQAESKIQDDKSLSSSRSFPAKVIDERSLPEAFKSFVVSEEFVKWSTQRPALERACTQQVFDCWERNKRQKLAQSTTDESIADHWVRLEMEKVKARFNEYVNPSPDPAWRELLSAAGSTMPDQTKIAALCAKLASKPCDLGQRIIGDASVVSGGGSISSNLSRHSKRSASSGPSNDVSKDVSVISSGDGGPISVETRTITDSAKMQSKHNADNPLFHGEWVITLAKKGVWGKAYVSSDGSYLAQHKKNKNVAFSISGDGTDACPFLLTTRKQEPATLIQRGPHSLVWKLANGAETHWTRP